MAEHLVGTHYYGELGVEGIELSKLGRVGQACRNRHGGSRVEGLAGVGTGVVTGWR
ncbi:MAG: hypothetical protein OEM81_11045 [Acidimicrobiia bacterium]|nr:hypothetical protein [Acidimicrobiia bacterium]MDH3398351.1 hypothetical protein [Acidimicrobiia bacterium]